ncbi:MAG TPA: hypothetical protein DCL38_04610 [Lachnospiraceae bacterium]|nr:hypothetical protein [Lachnospiraceae bacterium]
MNEAAFLKKIVKLKALARSQENLLTRKQVEEGLFGLDITEEQLKYVYDYLRGEKIRVVKGPVTKREAAGAQGTEPSGDYGAGLLKTPERGTLNERRERLNGLLSNREEAVTILPELYLKDVEELARLYEGQGVLREDLIGEGNVALVLAAGALELCESAAEIEEMVVRMVMEAMENLILTESGSNDSAVRILERVNELNDRAKELSEDLERLVTVEELAVETDMEPELIRELIRLTGNRIEYIK